MSSLLAQKGNALLIRDVYGKLSSTFGNNSNYRIAVLKTAAQAKGGTWGELGASGNIGNANLFKGSDALGAYGGILGDIFGVNSKDIMADVIFSYNHKANVKLTENPVEDGVLINDHRIIEAKTLVIEIGINSGQPKQNNPVLRGAGLLLFGKSLNSQSRVIDTYSDLIACQTNGEPFDIETPVGTYKNMLITSIEAMQDAATINVFKGSITFRELIIYDVQTSGEKKSDTSGVFKALQTGIKVTQDYTRTTQSYLPTSVNATIGRIF